jgi:hypothetical protein
MALPITDQEVTAPMTANQQLDQDPRIHPAIRAAYEAGTLTVAPYEDLYSQAGIAVPLGQAAPVLLITPSSPYRSVAGRTGWALPPPPAAPAGEGTMPPMFDSAEHAYLGNQAVLTFLSTTGQPQTVGGAYLIPLPNGLNLQFGQIVALAGDFFGCITTTTSVVIGPDGPQPVTTTQVQEISDANARPAAFQQAFNSLATDSQTSISVPKILAVMSTGPNSESAALTHVAYSGSGAQPSTAYTPALDLDDRYNVASGGGSLVSDKYPEGNYYLLAEVNWDHFGSDAVSVYETGAESTGCSRTRWRRPAMA